MLGFSQIVYLVCHHALSRVHRCLSTFSHKKPHKRWYPRLGTKLDICVKQQDKWVGGGPKNWSSRHRGKQDLRMRWEMRWDRLRRLYKQGENPIHWIECSRLYTELGRVLRTDQGFNTLPWPQDVYAEFAETSSSLLISGHFSAHSWSWICG